MFTHNSTLSPTNKYHAYTQKKSPSKHCCGRYAQSQVTARCKRGPEHSGEINPRSLRAVAASGPSQRVANITLATARPASVRRERPSARVHASKAVSERQGSPGLRPVRGNPSILSHTILSHFTTASLELPNGDLFPTTRLHRRFRGSNHHRIT